MPIKMDLCEKQMISYYVKCGSWNNAQSIKMDFAVFFYFILLYKTKLFSPKPTWNTLFQPSFKLTSL